MSEPIHPPSPVAMIFEFWFDPDRPDIWQEYLSESEGVRALLGEADGFLEVERFQSTVDPNKYLAIGLFADEDAVTQWRTTPGHRRVQALGRDRLFTRYRLRMADVTRDYDGRRRADAPADSRAFHDHDREDTVHV